MEQFKKIGVYKIMKTFSLLLVLCFGILFSFAHGQTHRKKLHKSPKSKTVKKKIKTISGGVVNGKALNLVKPEYPTAAQILKVDGTVQVQVLIDEFGKVIEAKVISGHPFLKANSIKAAFDSTFEPINLSGEPVRVSGIIFYNFLPNEWNWLEYGYALNDGSTYYSTENLLKIPPLEYFEGIQLLEQFKKVDDPNLIIEAVIASIREKLNDDQKSAWFFEVGLTLAKSKQDWNIGGHNLNKNPQAFQELIYLIQNPPLSGNERLIEKIKKFIFFVDEGKTTQGFSTLRTIEDSFFYDGK